MHRNKATDSATRTASARAMVFFLSRPSTSRPRTMATPSHASAPSIATNATAMSTFIRSHYGVLLATLIGVAAASSLGMWQLDRAAQKRALQQALDERKSLAPMRGDELARTEEAARQQHYRAVHLQGRWLPRYTVFLDNRQMEGRPGFFVVTPLVPEGTSQAVIVQRGWVPRDMADRTRLPHIVTPSGDVVVDGRIAPPPARLYEFAPAASGGIRQNLDL